MVARSRVVLIAIVCVVLTALAAGGILFLLSRSQITQSREYVKNLHAIERNFITRVPIYDDFATPQMEQDLRKFLLMDHLQVAERIGVPPVESDAEVQKHLTSGKLVAARMSEDADYHFYNVPPENRYLTPRARDGLVLIADRFQKNLEKRYAGHPPVRIAISSVLRTLNYQKDLQKKNPNASFASSHSYGVSFDIFYDDYYVKLPEPPAHLGDEFRTRLGYLLGDSLMRQFKAVLLETLIQLQEEGEIYAILERNQRCYHVTVLEKK
ncbi:MAG: hypothetical protein JNM27_12450 [Leptospirales bacterium]|nr:hypothetical protein [Leptospirales bacterium]